jgi:hypothetical protein
MLLSVLTRCRISREQIFSATSPRDTIRSGQPLSRGDIKNNTAVSPFYGMEAAASEDIHIEGAVAYYLVNPLDISMEAFKRALGKRIRYGAGMDKQR